MKPICFEQRLWLRGSHGDRNLLTIQVMEVGKCPPLDDLSCLTDGQTTAEQASLTQLNDAIALNFAMHDHVMSWQRSGKGENVDSIKCYANSPEPER